MAPEQAKDVSCAWPESDLYSLGAVLFHLLTGRPPFVADSTVGVLVQHASRPAPPVRSLAPAIRPSLAHIVDRLLSKRPDQRPSARELAEALRCVLHEPRSAVFEASAPAKAAAGPAALSRTWLRHETELASVLARRSAEWGEGIEAALRSRRSMLERGRPLAEALLDLGLVPREVLDQAASEVRAAADRAFDEAFGRFVVEAGLAGSEEVQKALAGAARHSSSRAAPPSVSTPLARTRSPGGLPVRAAARTQTGAGDAELLSAGAADASVPLMVALVDAGTISCADAVAVEARCERHLREADTAVTCEVARSRGVPDEALTAARFELDDLSRGDDRSLLNLLVEAGVIAEETAWELAADQVRAVLSGTGQTR